MASVAASSSSQSATAIGVPSAACQGHVAAAVEEVQPTEHGKAPAHGGQHRGVRDQFLIGVLPVEPGQFVILAIGVVVPVLGSAEFVAGRQHDGAAGGKQRRQQC